MTSKLGTVRHRILAVCPDQPGQTSSYRVRALTRLGHEIAVFDPWKYQPKNRYVSAAVTRYPIGPLVWRVNRDLLRVIRDFRPDVVWFDKPLHFTRSTIEAVKKTGAKTVCYIQDAPFGPRNDGCWYQFYKVFRLFDLHCLFRNGDIPRYSQWRLPWIRIHLSYEPTIHFAPPSDWSDSRRTRGVSYIGHPHESRAEFMRCLADDHRLPVAVSGGGWERVLTPEFRSRWVRNGLLIDDRYREEIWKSRINLSFVTKLNEEDIGHKSMEIAACQGFLLALRTEGHQAVFEEDKEAVFFSDVEECADKCRFYLNRPDLREAIAARGRARAVRSGYDNDTQLRRVLERLDQS